MACGLRIKNDVYYTVLKKAIDFAIKNNTIYVIFLCGDWDFCPIKSFDVTKYEHYEYITPDYYTKLP